MEISCAPFSSWRVAVFKNTRREAKSSLEEEGIPPRRKTVIRASRLKSMFIDPKATHSRVVPAQRLLPDGQRVIQQVGGLLVLVLISATRTTRRRPSSLVTTSAAVIDGRGGFSPHSFPTLRQKPDGLFDGEDLWMGDKKWEKEAR